MKTRAYKVVFPLAVLALVLGGCQPAEEAPQTAEERAQARWDHLLAEEYAEAWAHLSPGSRDLYPESAYSRDMRQRPFRWLSGQVVGSECQENQCDVLISATYKTVRGPSELRGMEMTRELTEKWVRVDGQWWYIQN